MRAPTPIRRMLAAAARARTELRIWWAQANHDTWYALAVTLACFAAMTIWVNSVAGNATDAANGVRRGGEERTQDLINRCLATSKATAQDVLLNWQHYQSEASLDHPPSAAQKAAFKHLMASIPASFRSTVAETLGANQSGHALDVLHALANSDFNAAYAKARNVDQQYAKLIPLTTPTGGASPPRNWIITAHYSCEATYRPHH